MDNREAIRLLDELLLKVDFTDQNGYMDDSSPYEEAVEIAKQAIEKQMPSIQPKQKTGRWIDDNCSECGQYVYHGDANNYCPNCGAYMKGESNDKTTSN